MNFADPYWQDLWIFFVYFWEGSRVLCV